jgi:hypothetical protein
VRARGWLLLAVTLAVVLLLVGRTATVLYVDLAWFAAMGAPSLFWEQVLDRALLQGGAWLVGSGFAFANLHAVRRTILTVAVPSRVANIELTAMVPGRRLLSATIIVALLVGAVLAIPLTNWEDLALVRHGVPFGEIEGIFDRDLGHYVYWLPLEEALYLWSLVSVVAVTALVLVLYALTRSLRLEGRRIAASSHVRRHLSVLGALVLLLLAWSYRLDAFDLLQQGSGPDGQFLRVDHRVTLRMDAVLAYGSAIAALIILRTGWAGQLRAAFVTLTTVLVAAVLLRHAAPVVLARGDTLGDPARRDLDYVASRALYSRRAFDVNAIRMTVGDSSGAAPVPTRIASLAARTSLWDRTTLERTVGEPPPVTDRSARVVRPARNMDAAPMGWTVANGHLSALLLHRPTGAKEDWRAVVLDVTRPVLRDSTIDVAGTGGAEADPWPLVGPGMQGERLLDAAVAPEVPAASLASRTSRLAHAWALRNVSLLHADTAAAPPVLVTYRDVRERVRRLAPVFAQGSDVVPVRDGDRLYWTLHLYSASDRYPLSQRWQIAGRVYAYFKLAATAVVDAATGRVLLVSVAHPDPLMRTWMTRWPALFTPVSALPASLGAQLPPASDGAFAQARTFARYGSRSQGSDTRHLPDSAFVGGTPAPVLFDGGRTAVLGWSVPVLGPEEQLNGVFTATGGAERSAWWSRETPPTSWRQTISRLQTALDHVLDSARTGAREATRRDTRWRLGRPQPLVSTRGVLVFQTLSFARGDGSTVVARVAITDGTRTGVGPTLGEALQALGETVSAAGEPAGPPVSLGTDSREAGAARLYEAMREAMQRGDWRAFGAAFDSLGRVLGRPPQ